MKKKIIIIVLLGTLLLGLIIVLPYKNLLPYKNKPVKVNELNYASLFNDLNRVQLKTAVRLGLEKPLKDRKDAKYVKGDLVRIKDNNHYSIAKLTHSIPYLTEGAAELLDMIGKNFLDSLASKGLNPNKIIVTSVLRTQEDIKRLQKSGNPNAVKNSAHCYATTFDITYARFDKIKTKNRRPYESVKTETLKWVLGEVLRDLRNQNKCYVKYEVKQRCFHITTRI